MPVGIRRLTARCGYYPCGRGLSRARIVVCGDGDINHRRGYRRKRGDGYVRRRVFGKRHLRVIVALPVAGGEFNRHRHRAVEVGDDDAVAGSADGALQINIGVVVAEHIFANAADGAERGDCHCSAGRHRAAARGKIRVHRHRRDDRYVQSRRRPVGDSVNNVIDIAAALPGAPRVVAVAREYDRPLVVAGACHDGFVNISASVAGKPRDVVARHAAARRQSRRERFARRFVADIRKHRHPAVVPVVNKQLHRVRHRDDD